MQLLFCFSVFFITIFTRAQDLHLTCLSCCCCCCDSKREEAKVSLLLSNCIKKLNKRKNGILHLVLVNGSCNETNKSVENLLDKYSAVVIVSGDGLLFEVIQGLFQRQAQCDIYTQNNIISSISENCD